MDLKWIRQMAERINELEEENKRLKGLLEEQDNKQVLNMTKPQPCTKYSDAERMAWIAKLVEETHEVVQEAQIVAQLEKADEEALSTVLWEARKRLAMELTDVITVCVSWLDAQGWDEEERDELQRLVNEKNRERGYF
jgi:succinate dehydrogenase flavin-adding protein (antitoxin of CptAB toxin-antitoxin module)